MRSVTSSLLSPPLSPRDPRAPRSPSELVSPLLRPKVTPLPKSNHAVFELSEEPVGPVERPKGLGDGDELDRLPRVVLYLLFGGVEQAAWGSTLGVIY